jgi:hypothetical protein
MSKGSYAPVLAYGMVLAAWGCGGTDARTAPMLAVDALRPPMSSLVRSVSKLEEVPLPLVSPPAAGSGDCLRADAARLLGLGSGYRAVILAVPSQESMTRRILVVADANGRTVAYSDLKLGEDGYFVLLTDLPRLSARSQVHAAGRVYHPSSPMQLLTSERLGNPSAISNGLVARCGW